MKILHLKFTTLFFVVLMAFNVQAQSYGSYQLPHPYLLTPLFIGSISESNIYYGDEPWGSANKPVIVFVHGFVDLANLWFAPGNRMYEKAHHAGYRTAYVAMTRGGGMWTNGEILSQMLDDITAHYNVDDVVIVAHSNGGKASEVAMFEHDKYDKVERVLSLGTPFWGTELADLSQTFLFSWLVDFIGLGDGAATSTTYYMGGVARPYLDGQPDNQPGKFINYGAWGYAFGNNLLSPTMLTSGGILAANGAGSWVGGNDGVTPYRSSTRPGGDPYWSWGFPNPYNAYDHIDVALDYIMWNKINPMISSPLPPLRQAAIPSSYPSKEVISNMQLVSSQGDYQDFTIEKNAESVELSLFFKEELAGFQLVKTDENGKALSSERLDISEVTEGFMGTTLAANLRMNDLQPGYYRLEGDEDFAGAVHYQNGVSLQYTSDLNDNKLFYETSEAVNMQIELLNAKKLGKAANINAIVTKVSDLKGEKVAQEVSIVEFRRKGKSNSYKAVMTDNLSEGVYNVMVTASHEDFTKSLVTGFTVQNTKEIVSSVENNASLSLSVFPNPVSGNVANVSFELTEDQNSRLSVYDLFGRVLVEADVTDYGVGTHTIELDLGGQLANGLYFLEVRNGRTQNVVNMVKVD